MYATSETEGQSVESGEKAGRKFSSTGERALSPVLQNFRPVLSPDPTDCPWVSEDGVPGIFHAVILINVDAIWYRPFSSSKTSHFQNEAKLKTFLLKMSFFSNGFALSLALKQKLGATLK